MTFIRVKTLWVLNEKKRAYAKTSLMKRKDLTLLLLSFRNCNLIHKFFM